MAHETRLRFARRGIAEASAEAGLLAIPHDRGGDRPAGTGAAAGDLLEARTPQPAARRQERDRLQEVGLAGAVLAVSTTRPGSKPTVSAA